LPERIQLAKDIAELHARDGDATSATNYLRLAIHLAAHDDARVAAFRARIATIEAADRLDAANDTRRPIIHKTLDQALTVRQRLTVAPDEAPPATKKEEE
jgi:chorismate mutase